MRVLVCGSRDWIDRAVIVAVLEGLRVQAVDQFEVLTVIEGCATGADRVAHEWWDTHSDEPAEWVEHEHHPADWRWHGKSAGPIRNGQMLEAKPDVVWAFVTKPLEESRGTADMVRRARAAGIPTYVVATDPP
jgi:hypothetical protein